MKVYQLEPVGIFYSLLLHKTACLYKDLIASHSLSNYYLSLPAATGYEPGSAQCKGTSPNVTAILYRAAYPFV